MKKFGIKNPNDSLEDLDITGAGTVYWNLSPEELMEQAIRREQGIIADSGALAVQTGRFTGRAPGDRYIVRDKITKDTVDWGRVNLPFEADKYPQLKNKITQYFKDKDIFVRDAYACADKEYRLNIRVVTEFPWSNQFAYNMFLRPDAEELPTFEPAWTILCAPGFHADPATDGTFRENFAIINFTEKQIIIGGTGYTGEIKKGIFSVLNFLLPKERGVLAMHCSANVGRDGDVAIFFGLSGTGKTTLSADPQRCLIGDDEHGWSDKGIFNFEGGCYAKTIDLTEEKEPDIYHAIRHGAILENVHFFPGTRKPDYSNSKITENTRVSYPLSHIGNALLPSKAGHPSNIFFLTCDAFGVLPPISRLTPTQAMYYFMSGYTAKVAGTEEGIDEPQSVFSACFGAPFLPLHPYEYAEMLGQKMKDYQVNVWLINTGWTGGPFGVGHRIKLKYTRAMISAVLEGKLDRATFRVDEIFGLRMPVSCPEVPDELLNPRKTWADKSVYDRKAQNLATAFNENFRKFETQTSDEIKAAAPRVLAADKV